MELLARHAAVLFVARVKVIVICALCHVERTRDTSQY